MVDDDPPAAVEPHTGLLEPETCGVGRAAGSEQHRIRGQDIAGGERDTQPTVDPPDPLRTGAEDHPDSAPLELVGQQPGQLTVKRGQQPVGPADQRRRRTERGERAGELDADRAAADDDDVLGAVRIE